MSTSAAKPRYIGSYATRAAYENALADRLRAQLFELLGPECGLCGCDLRETAWELNHLFRRAWKPSKVARCTRQRRYLKEARAGLCNLLCKGCNAVYRPLTTPPALTTAANDPF